MEKVITSGGVPQAYPQQGLNGKTKRMKAQSASAPNPPKKRKKK
jgi:hypothetical protein